MIRTRVLMLICVVTLFTGSDGLAQAPSKGIKLRSKDLSWMSRNGFDHANYNWNNNSINTMVGKALAQRRKSNSNLGFGLFAFTGLTYLGMMGNIMSERGKNEGNPFLIAGGGVLVGTVLNYLLLRKSGRSKLKKAQALRYKM